MNTFVYHKVPREMIGNNLYALNSLKSVSPILYESAIKKYKNRIDILNKKVTPLNCLWSDVIHLSPIDPKIIKKAMIDSGIQINIQLPYYKISTLKLDPSLTTLYFPSLENRQEEFFATYPSEQFSNFELPNETVSYYARCIDMGVEPLMYYGLPHIFYKGDIDINGVEVINI